MSKTGSKNNNTRGASSRPQPNEGEVLANVNTFAITRLVETALVNISRIEQIWKILVKCIMNNLNIDCTFRYTG